MTSIQDNFAQINHSYDLASSTSTLSDNPKIEVASNDLQGRIVTVEHIIETPVQSMQLGRWFADRKAVITTVALGLLVGAIAIAYSKLNFFKEGPEKSLFLADKIGDLLLKRLEDKEIADIPFSVDNRLSVPCKLANATYLTCLEIDSKLYESTTIELECAAHKLLREGKISAYMPRRVNGVQILRKGDDPTKFSTEGKPYDYWFTQGIWTKEGKEYQGNENAKNNDLFCAKYNARPADQELLKLNFHPELPKEDSEQPSILADKIGDGLLPRLENKKIADTSFSPFNISINDPFNFTCNQSNATHPTSIPIEDKLHESDTNEVKGPEQSFLLVDKIGDRLLQRLGDKEIVGIPFSQFDISIKDQLSETCRLPNAMYLTCIAIEDKLYESDTNEVICAAHKLLRDGKIAAYIPRRVDGVELLKKGTDPTKYSTAGKVYSHWFTQGVRVKEGDEDKEYGGNEKANYNDEFCVKYYKRTIDDILQKRK